MVVSHGQANQRVPYQGVSATRSFFLLSFLFFSFPPFSFLESRGSFRSGRGRRADITRYWTGFAYACEIASVSRYTVSSPPSHPPVFVVVSFVPILFDDKESSYPSLSPLLEDGRCNIDKLGMQIQDAGYRNGQRSKVV